MGDTTTNVNADNVGAAGDALAFYSDTTNSNKVAISVLAYADSDTGSGGIEYVTAADGLPVQGTVSVTGVATETTLDAIKTAVEGTLTVGSHAVTNAGTFAVQVDGAALTSLQLLDDSVYTDGTGTPSKGLAVMGTDGTNPQLLSVDTSGHAQIDVLTMPTVTVADGGGSLTVDGTVTANAGTGTFTVDGSGVTQPISAASLPLPSGAATEATLSSVKTAVELIDDAKATIATTDVLRVAIFDNADTQITSFGSGDATAANQTTIIGHVDGIEGLLTTIDADTGSINTNMATVAGAVSGTEMQVDLVSIGTAATESTLSSIDGKLVTYTTDDLDTGTGTDTVTVAGIALPGAGGHVVGGTSTNPIRTDPTGTTTQPVSGTVSVTGVATEATLSSAIYTEGDIDATINGVPILWEDGGNALTTVTLTNALPVGGSLLTTIDADTDTIATNTTSMDTTLSLINASLNEMDVAYYSEGDVDATLSCVAIGWEDAGNTVRVPSTTYPLPVDLGTATVTVDLGANNDVTVSGDVAHDTADSGNPVLLGARAVKHSSNPTAVDENDRVRLHANRHGILFTMGGHPRSITETVVVAAADGAQTNTAIRTVAAGTIINITRVTVTCSNANTVDVDVAVGFAAATLNTGSTTGDGGLVHSFKGIPPGGGVTIGDGSGILGTGADGEDIRYTCTVPTGGHVTISVTYNEVPS